MVAPNNWRIGNDESHIQDGPNRKSVHLCRPRISAGICSPTGPHHSNRGSATKEEKNTMILDSKRIERLRSIPGGFGKKPQVFLENPSWVNLHFLYKYVLLLKTEPMIQRIYSISSHITFMFQYSISQNTVLKK